MTILLNNVTKKYGSCTALDRVTLELEKGKIYGLLGPNGSGKSSTLKLITGLIYPNDGEILVLGERVTRRTCKHVSYLTELDMIYDHFTVGKLIDFYASQFMDFNMDKAKEIMVDMKLPENKQMKKLSKGNRGRVKLVLTLARKTPIILLDEPFSGLDTMVRDSIIKSLLKYIDFESQTVVIATHEIDEIEPIIDEVLAIADGHIIGNENVELLREERGCSVLTWYKELMSIQEEEGI